MNSSRLIKTAGVLDTVAKVAGGIARVCAIICIVFAVLVVVFGERMFVEGSLTLDLDFVKVHLAEECQTVTGMIKLYACVGLIAGSVLLYMMYYISSLLRRVFAPMKEGRPFDSAAPANIRRIAWAALISGGIVQLLGIVERVIITKAYPMDAVFASDAVEKLEYVFTVDFGFVAVFCVLMLLSYIFTYGQALQRESDETL